MPDILLHYMEAKEVMYRDLQIKGPVEVLNSLG